MTLACENETIEPCEVSESAAIGRIASVVGRQSETGGSPLAALAGLPISSRFCSWIGLSGRRYMFSVYPSSECPGFREAVLLGAVRDMTGRRRAILVRDTGAFPEPVVARAQRDLRAFGPSVELHLHLLAASGEERAATVADLAITPV
jgi:hypothetical protein